MFLFLLKSGSVLLAYRNILYAKYKAAPIIRLMVISACPPSKNFLRTPYEGGYPDTSPRSIKQFIHSEYKKKILISLKATCNELITFFTKEYPNYNISLWYDKSDLDRWLTPIPNDNIILEDIDFNSHSILTIKLEEKVDDENKIGKEEFPIFQEYFFEDVGDDNFMKDIDEEVATEIREEEDKKAREKERIDGLIREFNQRYKGYKNGMMYEYRPIKGAEIIRNLEELLNSYQSI